MIYDIIVILIILISAFIGYKVGLGRTLLSLLGSFLAFSLAVFLGDYLSTIVYDSVIRDSIISSFENAIATQTHTVSIDSFPPFVRFAFAFTDYDINALLSDAAHNVPSAVASSVESALRPIVVAVLSFVLTALLFVIIYFLFRTILFKLLCGVLKLPVIKGFDSLLGVLFSLINSVLFISFAAFLLKLVMPYIDNPSYIFSESTIYNSYIFYHFYSGNIFNNILSVF